MKKLSSLLLGAAAFGLLALAPLGTAHADLCAPGNQAEVLWKGTWYPAVVKRTRGDSCYIHYKGYNNSWDEWVGPDRIRLTGGDAPAVVVGAPGIFQIGEPVSVLWHGTWYPAHVLRTKGNKLYIHYDGYDNSWDEWVGPARYRHP
ncbi:MAG: Tudor-knot domain-containing protein [bacterium]